MYVERENWWVLALTVCGYALAFVNFGGVILMVAILPITKFYAAIFLWICMIIQGSILIYASRECLLKRNYYKRLEQIAMKNDLEYSKLRKEFGEVGYLNINEY